MDLFCDFQDTVNSRTELLALESVIPISCSAVVFSGQCLRGNTTNDHITRITPPTPIVCTVLVVTLYAVQWPCKSPTQTAQHKSIVCNSQVAPPLISWRRSTVFIRFAVPLFYPKSSSSSGSTWRLYLVAVYNVLDAVTHKQRMIINSTIDQRLWSMLELSTSAAVK